MRVDRAAVDASRAYIYFAGREQEAQHVLARLHAQGDIQDPFVVSELLEMKTKIEEERGREQGWSEIFHNSTNMRKIFMGIIVQFSVQMTGVSAIQYYAP